MSVAGFGWELTNINGNGADVYIQVHTTMTLNSVNVDVAFMVTSAPTTAGSADVLCRASVSRGAAPTFNNTGGHARVNLSADGNFGTVTVYNPNGLSVGNDGNPFQDLFYSVVLKTWVPTAPTASATSRQVLAVPSLTLNVGDYLVFHMDHTGVSGDVEMQVILQYT